MLKHEISDFFGSISLATPELKTQVAGLVEVLGDQADGLREAVKAAKEWLDRIQHQACDTQIVCQRQPSMKFRYASNVGRLVAKIG